MKKMLLAAVLLGLAASAPAAPLQFGEGLRMNQIQVLGTHNSYHKRPPTLGVANLITRATEDWDYEHLPLDVQLNNGVRSFELDIHNVNGTWAVFHLPLIDAATTCATFRDCLELVRQWSDAHPRHVPISFLIEYKDEGRLVDTRIAPLDAPSLDRLDADVRAVFPGDRLITPDDVRGDFETLNEAILKRGWPTLESARGKVFFVLHEGGENRDLYLNGHPSLKGRALFVRSEPGRPECAALVRDNPNEEDLQELVLKGYWVRSTAGGPPSEKRPGTERRDKALASGAHVVSSDYPPGEPDAKTGYVVAFPEGSPARCNPLNAPADCVTSKLE